MTNANTTGITGDAYANVVTALRAANPSVFDAIAASFWEKNPQIPAQPVTLPKVGDAIVDRGVYLGTWEVAPGNVVHAYAADDFLRDKKGKQLLVNFNEATREFAARNGGRRYGTGTEAEIRQAIKTGAYQDGHLVLPSKELLHGRDEHGNTTRSDAHIYALMNTGKLPKIAAAVQKGVGDQRWAVSGSEHPDVTSFVSHVSLTFGVDVWDAKGTHRSGAVPVRFYRSPTAAGPALQPQVGG